MVYRFRDAEVDVDALVLRRDGEVVHVEPQVFDVLRVLIENRERVVPKDEILDEVWGSRFVSESALTSRVKAVRSAVGDDGRTQAVVRTAHGRGYQFVAPVEEVDVASRPAASRRADAVPIDIRFVEGSGGVQLALGLSGQGMPLIKTANWLTHVDKDSNSPVWRHWVRDLSADHQLVRYDARGCGLSDRDLKAIPINDLDLWVDDLERVVDAVGQDRFVLLGVSQGGPVAVEYACRHPDRVAGLVLWGAYGRGMKIRGDATEVARADVQVDLARVAWEADNASFRQVFAEQFVPGASEEQRAWFSDLLRETTNATNAPQLEAAFHRLDITSRAREVQVPTLVMHATNDAAIPFEEGRRLAGLIPGATFVAIESANHILLESEPGWNMFLDRIRSFAAQFG
jgi:pimeloyl-ACP methyl ester carboxylesterase